MKFIFAGFIVILLAVLFTAPVSADCTNIQKHNWGSVNNNCNNNSNSQNQSQTQNNNQSVNITMPAVQMASTVTVLPHTGPVDGFLYALVGAFPLGIFLRKKSL